MRDPDPLLGVLATPTPAGGPVDFAIATPIVGGAVISADGRQVVFGDLDGNVYALDPDTGAELWVRAMNPHPLGGIAGNSLLLVDDMVVIGMASLENTGLLLGALGISYPCCTHTGFVVALDIATGQEYWRYDTLSSSALKPLPPSFAPFAVGPAGADIWGQPTYQRESDTIYIGTGQNFSPKLATQPPFSSARSDSIMRWTRVRAPKNGPPR